MSQEDRIAELELALENLLECFEETPTGFDIETSDGIGRITEAAEEMVIQAREALDHDDATGE
jgi:hypothetical protein